MKKARMWRVSYSIAATGLMVGLAGSTMAAERPSLTLDKEVLVFEKTGGSEKVGLVTNTAWIAVADGEWISVLPESGTASTQLTVSVGTNLGSEPLSGLVTVTAGTLGGATVSRTLLVNQAGIVKQILSVSPEVLDFDYYPLSPEAITISSNTGWRVSETADWISVVPAINFLDGSVTVTATENTSMDPRSATITVTNGTLTKPVTVNQAGRPDLTSFIYTIIDGEVCITGFACDVSEVTIPESIDGYPVAAIGAEVFAYCDALENINIPASVHSIGYRPFTGCNNLVRINVSTGNMSYESVGGVLFDKAKKTLIQYPGGLSGAYTVPEGTETIWHSAFMLCSKLSNISFPSTVTSIGVTAMWGCVDLASLNLSEGIISIGSFAFGHCYPLTSVWIPASVQSIGDGAFKRCDSLQEINTSLANIHYFSWEGVLYDISGDTLIQFPGGFSGAYSVRSGVEEIAPQAFAGCDGLQEVTLPEGLTTVGSTSFDQCRNLSAAYFLGHPPEIVSSVFEDSPATVYYIEGMPGWGSEFSGRPALPFDPDWLWGKYAYVEDGDDLYADTGSWLAWFEVTNSPWVWHIDTSAWYYIPEPVATAESGWIYIPNLAFESPNLWLVMMPGSDWGWSYGLSKWLLVREDLRQGNGGWVYLQ